MQLDKLMFSKKESAHLLGLSEHTVTRDIRLGRIAAKRYGRRVLISRDEILRLANEGMKTVSPGSAV